MEIQEAIDIRYEEIEGLQQKLTEDHYMNPEQEDELEELIAQAIKFGELCAKRDAKAQAVPEGFVLIKDDTKTVVAIERMVEQQVEASGMDSRRLERLDGWKIIEAAVKAQEPADD